MLNWFEFMVFDYAQNSSLKLHVLLVGIFCDCISVISGIINDRWYNSCFVESKISQWMHDTFEYKLETKDPPKFSLINVPSKINTVPFIWKRKFKTSGLTLPLLKAL